MFVQYMRVSLKKNKLVTVAVKMIINKTTRVRS